MSSRFLKKPFFLGKTELPNNIFYAPLAGCSDYPFRKISSLYKPGLIYCEMVKMEPVIRGDARTLRMLDYTDEMHPIGAQLCGSKPSLAGPAARILEDLGFDVIDLNCGCPVDKVTKDGSGSAMLKTPDIIGEVLCNMIAAVKIPVTVKIRAGWDESTINAAQITKIAEEAGAQAICIHGRTRQQAYKGPANWDYIKECKQVATRIKVIGNGDVTSPQAAERMFQHTNCDAVLVARGTMGQPWIAQDIIRHLSGEAPIVRTLEDCRQALYQHFQFTNDYHNGIAQRVSIEMRRVGCWYLKKSSGTRAFRELISKASDPAYIKELILNFPLGEMIAESEESPDTDNCECG